MSSVLVITVKYKAFRITLFLLKCSSPGATDINSIYSNLREGHVAVTAD